MMGAAERISDLRSLLSIVAEETGALKMNDANEDSVGWTTEGPLPMTFGHVRRAHAALAALETALSAAEPVGWFNRPNDVHGYQQVAKEYEGELGTVPLYAAPPAPSVAVKALEWKTDTLTHTKDDGTEFPSSHYWTAKHHVPGLLLGWEISRFVDERFPKVTRSFVLRSGRNEKEFATLDEAKAAAQADYEARIRSALSAQVQDVATHRHKKRGSEYALIGVGRMQAETWQVSVDGFDQSIDMQEIAIYRSIDDGSLWARPLEEFNDGRFEPLPAAPAKQEGKL